MGKADYPLKALYELRERALDERRQALADALSVVAEAERALQQRREILVSLQDDLAERRRNRRYTGAEAAHRLVAQGRYIARGEDAVVGGQAAVAEAGQVLSAREADAERARAAVASAQGELEVLARNRERWNRSRAEREERAAELELEDIVNARAKDC